jgi:ribosomal protein S27E
MLTEIKSRYDGNCVKCNRELKAGWDVFYDKDARKIYCTKCGKEGGRSEANLLKTIGFTGLCSNCRKHISPEDESFYSSSDKEFLCLDCGTMSSTPQGESKLISAKLETKFDEITSSNKLISELLGMLDDQLKDMQHNLSLLCARYPEKEKKEKAQPKK